MKGVNLVIIMGRLGNDPEFKQLASGSAVTTFNVATSEVWTDKQGQRQEKTEWHKVVAWAKLAEVAAKYLAKGSEVHVQGKLATRSWEDKDTGTKRYATEIVASQIQFVGSKRTSPTQGDEPQGRSSFGGGQPEFDGDEPDFTSDSSDDIPF